MLSLILPARNWPCDRIEACVRSFLRLKSKTLTEIVIVDFGSTEPIALKVKDKRVRLVYVKAERWSLAEAINVGVVVSRNPVVAKTDADIIIDQDSGPTLDAAVHELAAGKLGLGLVQATDLPPEMDATTALAASSSALQAAGRLRARWGQGGLCLFTVADWNAVGGFESRFHGWGNEDNDFSERMKRAGRRVRWLKQSGIKIFHVWHSPTYASKDIIKARSANQQIFAEDKSTFRPIRFIHSKRASLPAPHVANTPRPLVTVAFASKGRDGRDRMLSEAIRGFVGQIENQFEVLVADNGSTPEQAASLRKMIAKFPRSVTVRVVDFDRPSIPGSRNFLTDEARGRYICVADDDDIPLPTRLADHVKCFESDPSLHGSHGGWIDFDEITGIIDYNTGGDRKLETMMYGRGKVTAHPASFYRRDAMQAVRYDEAFKVGSDLDMAVRMANVGFKIGHTGSYVTLRRFHESNVTITDLSGQMWVGVDARQRVTETFGSVVEQRLREAGKALPPGMPCANLIAKDEVMTMIPGYCGIWRVLLPLAHLNKSESPAANLNSATAPRQALTIPGAELSSPAALIERASELATMMKGDVGIVDNGVDPRLQFISEPIKGAKKALQVRQLLEERFGTAVEVVPDVEFQRRQMKKFDWSKLGPETKNERLVSRPIRELDRALIALARLPGNTALRAMTSILADYNCTKQQFHLVTVPIRTPEGPRGVKRLLEMQTGEKFELLADAATNQTGQAA